MDSTDIKALVIKFMRKALAGSHGTYEALCIATLRLMGQDSVSNMPHMPQDHTECIERIRLMPKERPDVARALVECYLQIFIDGIIMPTPHWPEFAGFNRYMLTDFGKEWIKEQDTIPEDSQGYLKVLRHSIPKIDSVIEQYVSEALLTHNRRAFFAAAVMIGAASEKTIYLLIEALRDAVQDTHNKKHISKVIEKRDLPKAFKVLLDYLKSPKAIPYKVHEGSEMHLLSLMQATRVQRNDAVHPSAAIVSKRSVWLTLLAFPSACRKAYDLIDWLRTNKI